LIYLLAHVTIGDLVLLRGITILGDLPTPLLPCKLLEKFLAGGLPRIHQILTIVHPITNVKRNRVRPIPMLRIEIVWCPCAKSIGILGTLRHSLYAPRNHVF
jgi:hypothetical protein